MGLRKVWRKPVTGNNYNNAKCEPVKIREIDSFISKDQSNLPTTATKEPDQH